MHHKQNPIIFSIQINQFNVKFLVIFHIHGKQCFYMKYNFVVITSLCQGMNMKYNQHVCVTITSHTAGNK